VDAREPSKFGARKDTKASRGPNELLHSKERVYPVANSSLDPNQEVVCASGQNICDVT
jgi:hypothetical protein